MFYFLCECMPRLAADRRGITAVEYAVLALGVISAVAGAVSILGGAVHGLFGEVTNHVIHP